MTPSNISLVDRQHPARWMLGALALCGSAFAVYSIATNQNMEWSVVRHYLTASTILSGLWLTLWLTAVVTVLGLFGGIVLACARLSSNPILSALSWGYVWIFRSVPVLVQLLFWFNIAYLYPVVSFGIPFGPTFIHGDATVLISATVAAVLGLTLHEIAYAGEIIRGGILGVDPAQEEASFALGMSRSRALRRVILPQAMRSIIPAVGNMTIGTLKGTSIVSVIAVSDLLYSAQFIYNQTYQVVPLLLVASAWYLVTTSVLSVGQYYIERRFSRGYERTARAAPRPHDLTEVPA